MSFSVPLCPCLSKGLARRCSGLQEPGSGGHGQHVGSPNPMWMVLHWHRTRHSWSSSWMLVSLPSSAASHVASSHFLFPLGTHEVVAKPSPVATRQPRARDQERKKGSFTSSLRMEPHSRSGKSRKSTKFRSISRSLILCHAKTSDEGSSPDERYPDPFEIALGQGKDRIFHSSMQLADTSEAGPGSTPDLMLASEAAHLQTAGSDRGKTYRRLFFMKVRPGFVGLEESVVGLWCCE